MFDKDVGSQLATSRGKPPRSTTSSNSALATKAVALQGESRQIDGYLKRERKRRWSPNVFFGVYMSSP
jgi:hypothetical protein